MKDNDNNTNDNHLKAQPKPETAEPERQFSKGLDSRKQVAVILAQTAEILKAELSPREAAFWAELLSPYPVERIKAAFSEHIRRESFFPKPAQIFAWLDGDQKSEALAAWDTTVQFANKWVCSNVYGHYQIDRGCRRTPPPKLSERILDSVRLAGGWRTIRCMSDDEPFVKKAFIEAYESWTEIRGIPSNRLLVEIAHNFLPTPEQESKATAVPAAVSEHVTACNPTKRIPEPLTPAQLRARRSLLKQQLAQLAAQEDNATTATTN